MLQPVTQVDHKVCDIPAFWTAPGQRLQLCCCVTEEAGQEEKAGVAKQAVSLPQLQAKQARGVGGAAVQAAKVRQVHGYLKVGAVEKVPLICEQAAWS